MESSSLADEMFSSSPVADELLASVWWMAWGEQQPLLLLAAACAATLKRLSGLFPKTKEIHQIFLQPKGG